MGSDESRSSQLLGPKQDQSRHADARDIRPTSLERTELPLPLLARGKVRDVYAVGEDRLLLVATDRISALDFVLSPPVPGKGEVLTQLTAWWLAQLEEAEPHHLLSVDPDVITAQVPALQDSREVWTRRSMLVRRTRPLPIEWVVRGYISGSAWREYRRSGSLAGEPLPPGLVESQALEPAVLSPATKAAHGHDENIPYGRVEAQFGPELAAGLRRRSLALYAQGRERAEAAGIIIADTKFEFGVLPDGTALLIDEVLTPDSSRFWPRRSYSPGRPQPSLDKQPVRDYLERLRSDGRWNGAAPVPELPPDVVQTTARRYRQVFHQLTGCWPEE
ncbi:MAG: phosphoribosylaminoimidazolesuccinocarboxamide synthase, partial [Gemmatimonadetes bacterium]|nr:phosphoribosylaminoimidazolesuccinocarboxamide synthase [Gemmatimonadota bacterium]